ncbi:MAG TPA: ArsC family transcriptional regulator [Clostridiales bacterium]|nr:ArsC family transcriptional regulator [Clostridiales bacterium]
MNIQIYLGRKNFDSQKAERYFKERKIKYQAIDLLRFGMSKGEFQSVKQAVGLEALIDEQSKAYTQFNMAYLGLSHNAEEALLNHPELFRTPIVRNGKQATVGYQPDVWATWE